MRLSLAPWPTTLWCPNHTSAVLRWHGCANTRTFVTPMGAEGQRSGLSSGRTRVSLFSGNQDRGACTWNPKAIGHGQKTEVSTCPNSHAAQLGNCPPLMLRLMAVSPGLGLWWFLWQGDQRLIIVTALVYSSRQKLERALRAM